MVNVVATTRGYFGGEVRDIGERFSIPKSIMDDKKRRPSWVVEAGGAAAEPQEPESNGGDGLAGMKVPELRDYAEQHGIDLGDAKRKAEIIEAIEKAQAGGDGGDDDQIEPFGDAPKPQTAEPVRATNEVNDALGATQPDWVAPAGAAPTQVED
ncbi:Rho termination factor N-terminal domain-containing protein [Nitratireductor rhodophyticola]|uniref:Rho termination factor N-terminal domain-containing protein n=1 Tax=Nitratireductor rhodophyticola TaxID=2854036 RepID=UPI003BAD129F